MKDKFNQMLPFVVGFIVAAAILARPAWLFDSSIAGPVGAGLLVGAVLLAFIAALIAGNLPADAKLTPLDAPPLDAEMAQVMEDFDEAGFEVAGPAVRVDVKPPALLVPFIRTSLPAYATLFRTGTVPAVTAYDIVSILEPAATLTTSMMVEGTTIPPAPGSMAQAFPLAGVKSLVARHAEALEFLTAQGIRIKPVTAETFEQDFKHALARQRRHFLRHVIPYTLIAIWRSMTKRTPHLGPIQDQPAARRAIEILHMRLHDGL